MGLVNGIHHVSLKCSNVEEYNKTVSFYAEVLELPIVRRWDDGIMFGIGNEIIEIFASGSNSHEKGVIRHFALATDDVELCVKRMRENGYEVFLGPTEVDFLTTPVYKAKIAFCKGPLGEEIEFFQEMVG